MVRRESGLTFFDEPIFAGFRFDGLSVVFVGVEIKGAALGGEFLKNAVKLAQPVYGLNPRELGGLRFGQFGPFPNGNVVVGFP